ncbi:hypothetical protein ACA910_022453 [Epithemia clementina (nom. ined.)]
MMIYQLCVVFALFPAFALSASGNNKIPNDEGIPSGPYLTSCNGCKLTEDGEKLFCKNCPKSCGSFVSSEVSVAACESFSNNNGTLVCETLSEEAQSLPQGTYLGSCDGCSMQSNGMLRCTACKNSEGGTSASTVDVTGCSTVGNNDGRLVCESTAKILAKYLQKKDGLPDGDYLSSCSGCSYEAENDYFVLSCMACNTQDGDTKSSRIYLYKPCWVINKNGQLTCELRRDGVDKDGKHTAGIRISIKSNSGDLDSVVYDEKKIADGWEVGSDGYLRKVATGNVELNSAGGNIQIGVEASAATASHDEL